MSVNDPIGDMLTRIRNAQERGKPKVSTPASRLRERVLDVLQQEGFIRGYATVQQRRQGRDRNRTEILRWRAGHPRNSARVEAGPARLCLGRNPADRLQRPRHFHSFDAEGRHVRCRCSRPECGRRSHLHGILRNDAMSRIGKKAVPVPAGVTVNVERPERFREGAEGRAEGRAGRACPGQARAWRDRGRPAGQDQAGALLLGHVAHHGRQHDQGRDGRLFASRSRSTASAIAPLFRASRCSSISATATT